LSEKSELILWVRNVSVLRHLRWKIKPQTNLFNKSFLPSLPFHFFSRKKLFCWLFEKISVQDLPIRASQPFSRHCQIPFKKPDTTYFTEMGNENLETFYSTLKILKDSAIEKLFWKEVFQIIKTFRRSLKFHSKNF